MMTLTEQQNQLAKNLYQAFKDNQPLKSADCAGVVNDFDTAYEVQQAVMKLKGQPTAGYKVSLTSEQTQKMFDADSPLYGAQVADKFLDSGTTLSLKDYNEPLVEVEFEFTAKRLLTPAMSEEELLNNCYVAADMEVPDARFTNWFPDLDKYLVLSDTAVGGAVVGGKVKDGATLKLADLAHVFAVLTFNGEEQAHGQGSEVLGNPVTSLKWLVQKLSEQGFTFPAGTHASTGTFILPPHLKPGVWEAKFTDDFGTVTLNVTD